MPLWTTLSSCHVAPGGAQLSAALEFLAEASVAQRLFMSGSESKSSPFWSAGSDDDREGSDATDTAAEGGAGNFLALLDKAVDDAASEAAVSVADEPEPPPPPPPAANGPPPQLEPELGVAGLSPDAALELGVPASSLQPGGALEPDTAVGPPGPIPGVAGPEDEAPLELDHSGSMNRGPIAPSAPAPSTSQPAAGPSASISGLPNEAEEVLELDRPAPIVQPRPAPPREASASVQRPGASASRSSPGVSASRPKFVRRRSWGEVITDAWNGDVVVRVLLAATIGLLLGIWPASRAAQRVVDIQVAAALHELRESADRPKAVADGTARSPVEIQAQVEALIGQMWSRYFSVWLSISVLIGLSLALIRRRPSGGAGANSPGRQSSKSRLSASGPVSAAS